MNTQVRWGLLLAIFAGYALGQTTTINLATQGRNFDFSSAPYTRPASVGTALPATCTVGQMFFNISAPAGQNLYGCSSINAWTVVGNSNLPTASGSQSGILSASDWATFAAKQPALGFSPLNLANNLADVSNPVTALANLSGVTAAQAAAAAPVQTVNGVAPQAGNVQLASNNLTDSSALLRTTSTTTQALAGPLTSPQVNGEIWVDGTQYTSLLSAYAAASAASTNSDQTVRLGPGTYALSAGLVDPDNGNCVNIVGSAENGTILQASAAMATMILKGRTTKSFHCIYSSFTLDGNGLATDAMTIQQGKGWTIERIKVRRVANGGEGFLLGNTTDGEAMYETRFNNNTCLFDGTDYPVAANRPLNCLHLLTSAHDNFVDQFVATNTTNAGIQDDAGANYFDHIHVYGYPAPSYSPAYAMNVYYSETIHNLNADAAAAYGVYVRGQNTTITASSFGCNPACTGVFPVYVVAGVNYFTFANNTVSGINSLTLGGVGTPISWAGTSIPSAGSSVYGNTGYDSSNAAYNFANSFSAAANIFPTIATPSLTIVKVGTLASPTVTPAGTTGAAAYSYACTGVAGAGESLGATTSIGNGATALTSSNYNAVRCPSVNTVANMNVYRLSGGAAQGKIGSVTSGGTLNDTGLTAGGQYPSSDTTGQLTGLSVVSSSPYGGKPVAYSATPNFDLSLGDQALLLTGTVTGSTVANIAQWKPVHFQICQDAVGGRAFTWPAVFHGTMTIGSAPNTCSVQAFESFDGATLYSISAGLVNQ